MTLSRSDIGNMSTSTNSTSSSSVNNTNDILQRLSDERAHQLLPVFVVLVIIFVTGVVGNSLTVYIYWFKFKATRSRAAIVTLAAFDLISCLVAIPGEAVDLRFSFNYGSDAMCRILRACATFPSIASGIMLTSVAFDRYRLICTPHKLTSTMARKKIKRQLIIVCTLSLFVAVPAAVVYGTMTTNTGIEDVTGQECSTSDVVRHTRIPLIYNVFLSLIFITAFVTIIVCYCLVGRQVYRQGNFRKTFLRMTDRNQKGSQSELEPSSLVTSDPVTEPNDGQVGSHKEEAKRAKESLQKQLVNNNIKRSLSNGKPNKYELPSPNIEDDDEKNSPPQKSEVSENQAKSPMSSNQQEQDIEMTDRPTFNLEEADESNMTADDAKSSQTNVENDVTVSSQSHQIQASEDHHPGKSGVKVPQLPYMELSTPDTEKKEHRLKAKAGSMTLVTANGCKDNSVGPVSPLPSSPTSQDSQSAFKPRRKVSRTPSVLQRLKGRKAGSQSSANSWRTGKTTLMLALISFIFVLSYLPHLVVRVKRALDKSWLREDDVSSASLVAYSLIVRSYFLNSVANVFVYGVCSYKFRQECRKLARSLCRWRRSYAL